MRLLVVVLLALAAGFLSAYWGYEREAPTARRVDRNLWSAKPAAPDVPRGDPLAGVADTNGAYPDLRAALAAIPQADPARGDGVIVALVKTADGTPVSGVRITAEPTRFEKEKNPDDSGEIAVRNLVRKERWLAASRRQTPTGSDGTARLESLGAKKYYIRADHPGYEFPRLGRWSTHVAGAHVDIVARPIGVLDVRVLLPDGSKAEQANIEIRTRRTGREVWKWRKDARTRRFRPGTVHLRATAGEWNEVRSEETEVAVEPGVDPQIVTLYLEKKGGVVGRVVFAERGIQGELELRLVDDPGDTAYPKDGFSLIGRGKKVDAKDPSFRFLDVEPGRYLLIASADETIGYFASIPVEVKDSVVRLDLPIPAPTPEHFVRIEVYDPDGAPVENVKFSARLESPSWTFGRDPIFHYAVAPGTYLVLHPFPEGVSEGVGKITLSHADHGSFTYSYGLPMTEPIVHRIQRKQAFEITVEGFADSGYVGDVVIFAQTPRDPRTVKQNFSYTSANMLGADGLWRVDAFEGEFQVWLYVEPGLWAIAHKKIKVEGSEARFSMRFPTLHEVRVESDVPVDAFVVESVGNAPRKIANRLRFHGHKKKFTVRGLPAGKYRVKAGSGAWIEIEVPTSEPVRCRRN